MEPDSLMLWSLSVFLGRWFEVEATDAPDTAMRAVAASPVDVLVIDDDYPPEFLDEAEDQARRRNPGLLAIHLGAMVGSPRTANSRYLEKPFDLGALAKLAGVG
ncbi:MAG: hypothetical protein U1D55_08880 [Phycisphaerae bacterium]